MPTGTPPVDGNATPERISEHFSAALREFRNKQYERAAASFAAIEAECPPEFFYFVLAKTRRGICSMALERWAEALAIFDEITGDAVALAGFDRAMQNPELRETSFKDDVAVVYWSRCVCLEELGRLREATARGGELIDRVGTGATPMARSCVAGVYLLQAKYAVTRKQFGKAMKALDAAIEQCSTTDHPDAQRIQREAETTRRELRARVRIHRAPPG